MKTAYCSVLTITALAILTASTATVQGEDYLYETNNGTITITGYIGPGGDVTIPESINGVLVTELQVFAFAVPEITTITIPKTVTNIFTHALSAPNLTAMMVDPQNAAFSSLDGVLFNKSKASLMQFPAGKPGTYSIPTNVVTIGRASFSRCAGLTSIAIPSSVRNIESAAFEFCTSLTSVVIPNSVTNLGPWVGCDFGLFEACTSLTQVNFPDVTAIPLQAFSRCTSLTSFTIPPTVTRIENWAFGGCSNLAAIYFRGNAPYDMFREGDGFYTIFENSIATIYYLPGTTGWTNTYAQRPTAQWLLPCPVMLSTFPSFGIRNNAFCFRISWATNASVVVEASGTMVNPFWSPVSTNTLINGWTDFRDAEWKNYPARFYRVRQW